MDKIDGLVSLFPLCLGVICLIGGIISFLYIKENEKENEFESML